MKKLLVFTLVMISISIITGCSNSTETSSTEANQTESTFNSSQTIAEETTEQSTSSNINSSDTNSSEYIGEDQAKAIALSHAGIDESVVTFITVKMDYDDGRQVYDVEFYYESSEYDYEIDAYLGDIISFDYDIESYSGSLAQTSEDSYISLDAAQAIALEKVALEDSQVTFTKSKFDYDDGIAIYDIEFVSGDMEYEFEINAVSGAIIEYDVESVYD